MMARHSSLARLLQALTLLQLLSVAAWVGWQWPQAPVWAVLGALLIALIAPVVLAIEFVLLAIVGRRNTATPPPAAGALLRAWAGEVRQLARVFYWRLPYRWRQPDDYLETGHAGRRGVVFIHGFVCNRGFWAPWMQQMRKLGVPHVAVNLEPVFGPIEDYGHIVEAAVQRVTAATGRPPVLVCHSMGGLVARAWLRSHDGARRVARVITIGTPHGGTWLGRFSSTSNGRQMRLHSDWLAQLRSDEAAAAQPPFTCWYTNCDNIVFPVSTATLPDADNHLLPGPAHVSLAFAPALVQACLRQVAAEPST